MSDTTPEAFPLTGYRSTFHEMFLRRDESTPQIDRVEVPLIQRDYAQGREDPRTSAIRSTFLDSLHTALTGDTSIGLDFIYGEVRDGTFEPLDGQQRLTTLFLLHWYVAVRRGSLTEDRPAWTSFSYATRPSARLFCERIVDNPPPSGIEGAPSDWLRDQSWYLHVWRFDPTVRGMLVTIDAIANRFADDDADRLWSRLTDRSRPAVWFQLLPIDDMGGAENLYIKMNSRGKPLTEFEAFKALLGQLVYEVGGFEQFGHRIDGEWTDVLWPYRGDDDIVDDEFMRYFDFLMEICEWREDRLRPSGDATPADRITGLLGPDNARRQEHLAFIRHAFDTWIEEPSISEYFDGLFTLESDGVRTRLFGASATTDLFAGCLRRYGDVRGTTRSFSLADTLLLLAVLEHRRYDTAEIEARLRTLRNVSEASQFELRVTNMPGLAAEVSTFIQSGDLSSLRTYNANQVQDEALKRELRASAPEVAGFLFQLEDHPILRGTLAAFDLDESIVGRATAFEAAFVPERFPLVTGALLAVGEYQRNFPDSDQHRFGSPTTDSVWRSVLVDRGDRQSLQKTRVALGRMLDDIAASSEDPVAALVALSDRFTAARAARNHFDWRYHLVRYSAMREGGSGIYYGADGRIGYELTMLRKTAQNSYYRDAYLYAIWCKAGKPDEVKDPWFSGYSTSPRWMELIRSGAAIRCVQDGFAIRGTTATADAHGRLAEACIAADGVQDGQNWFVRVPQEDVEDGRIDEIDRVQRGAELLRTFLEAGL